ncbi:MAG TPA: fuculose phosphate aldolase [Chloroflexi bacterium]|nr:fuculose phosphate aldolase [Chloroflexota bacterium]
MLEQFQRFGKDLFYRGLTSSHGGNISVRMGDRLIITRTGAMLAHLTARDLIETGLDEDDSNIMLASSEIVVHRAIYQNTSALAIVHVHPPFAVAQSMCVEDAIIPIDSEGSYLFRKVPVAQTETTVGSKDVAKIAAKMLREYKIFMLRGHGCFSIGPVLEEAYQWCSSLEESCKIYCYTRTLQAAHAAISQHGLGDLEYRKHTDDYKTW